MLYKMYHEKRSKFVIIPNNNVFFFMSLYNILTREKIGSLTSRKVSKSKLDEISAIDRLFFKTVLTK